MLNKIISKAAMAVGTSLLLASVCTVALTRPALAQSSLTQGFDSVASLGSAGFVFVNNSYLPPTDGSGNWGQGNTSVFNSQSGAANSYIAAGYQSTGGTNTTGDTISN